MLRLENRSAHQRRCDAHQLIASPIYISLCFCFLLGQVTLIAGVTTENSAFAAGPVCDALFALPTDLLVLRDGSGILLADQLNDRIRFVDTVNRVVTTVAGSGLCTHSDGDALTASIQMPLALAFDTTTAIPESVVYISAKDSVRVLTREISKW